jgi:hypothetical protein
MWRTEQSKQIRYASFTDKAKQIRKLKLSWKQQVEPRAVAVSLYGWLKTSYGWLAG